MPSGFTDGRGEVSQTVQLQMRRQVKVGDLTDHNVIRCGQCRGLVLESDEGMHEEDHRRVDERLRELEERLLSE